jgi:hypothetical protein
MKFNILTVLFISHILISCGSDSNLNPVRQVASNSSLDQIKAIDDTTYLISQKNSLKIVFKSKIANLRTNEIYVDSIEVEKANKFGNKLFVQSKNELNIYEFTAGNQAIVKKSTIQKINICNMFVAIDTLVFINQGSEECGLNKSSKNMFVYSSNPNSKFFQMSDFQLEDPIDMKIYEKYIWVLEKSGQLKGLSFNATGNLKIETTIPVNGLSMEIFPSQKKLLIRTAKGLVQYQFVNGLQIIKLSEITI